MEVKTGIRGEQYQEVGFEPKVRLGKAQNEKKCELQSWPIIDTN